MRYKTEYCQALLDYFRQGGDGALPSLARFAYGLGIPYGLLAVWERDHDEFATAMREARRILEELLVDKALAKAYDPTFVKFLLSEPRLLWPASGAEDDRLTVEVVVAGERPADTP